MDSVFVLQHEHEDPKTGDEDVKFIGVYRTRERAEEAIERLKPQPGFVDSQHGFSIDEYRLDEDHWLEGFVSAKDAMPPHSGGDDQGVD